MIWFNKTQELPPDILKIVGECQANGRHFEVTITGYLTIGDKTYSKDLYSHICRGLVYHEPTTDELYDKYGNKAMKLLRSYSERGRDALLASFDVFSSEAQKTLESRKNDGT